MIKDNDLAKRADTLPQILEQQANRYASRVFLRDKHQQSWRDHSWSSIAERAARLRSGLARMGLRRGDRVAIMAENSPEWVVADMAILGLGAIVIPLYTTSGAEESRHIIADSGARLLVVNTDGLLVKARQMVPTPGVEAILAMHPGAAVDGGAGPQLVPVAEASSGEPMPAVEDGRDSLATFIYTSGTSGPPKGVMLSHGNIIANCESNLVALDLTEGDMTLSILPVAHSFERTGGYYTVMLGGGVVSYAEGLSHIAANLLEVEPTVVLVVPRLLEVIYSRVMRRVEASPPMRQRIFHAAIAAGGQALEYRNRGRALPPQLAIAVALFRRLVFGQIRGIFGRRLRYLISGGAPLPEEINRLLGAAEVPIFEGYGLTEASPVISCNLHGRARIGTVGRPLRNIEVRTADDGELLVRGPNVMKGYYHRESETREAIDAEGWLHTGDIARIDNEGYIRIVDRKKEIIVLSGGKNVSPAMLEARLVSEHYIAQACVIGDRRKHLAAILVPNFESLASDAAHGLPIAGAPPEEVVKHPSVRTFFQQRLREFNRPLSEADRIADFILTERPFSQENGELTPTLKVRRRTVQEHYRSQIEELYGS